MVWNPPNLNFNLFKIVKLPFFILFFFGLNRFHVKIWVDEKFTNFPTVFQIMPMQKLNCVPSITLKRSKGTACQIVELQCWWIKEITHIVIIENRHQPVKPFGFVVTGEQFNVWRGLSVSIIRLLRSLVSIVILQIPLYNLLVLMRKLIISFEYRI